jgi:ABC-2 type transport system ATP-binding protein
MMSEPAIVVEDLVKTYRRRGQQPVRAVDGLSFTVRRGSIFGLLGPNGAGKTTTLRMMMTLVAPDAGRIRVLGWDVAEHPLDVRRRLAVVIQENAAELFLTVRDNLLTFARFHGVVGQAARRRAEEVMAEFGLEADTHRKTMDLSGGFRRRVQVAKVFMVETPVAVLDEFATGMDPILKRSFMERLRREARRGRTIVLTTQVLSEAEELCDDILIVNHGRAVARGDLQTLKLLSEDVYDLTLTFDRVPDDIAAIIESRRPLRVRRTEKTLEFSVREEEAEVLALLSDLSRLGPVRRIEMGGPTLEDIFVALLDQRATSRGAPQRDTSG